MSTQEQRNYCDKYIAFENYVNGSTKTSIADFFGVSQRTVGRWIETVKNDIGILSIQELVVKISNGSYDENDIELMFIENKEWFIKNGVKIFNDDLNALEELKNELPEKKEAKSSSVEYKLVATMKSISITKVIDSAVEKSLVIDNKNENFSHILQIILDSHGKENSQSELAHCFNMMQPATMIEEFTDGKIKIDIKRNLIKFVPNENEEYDISNSLSKRVLQIINKEGKEGAQTLINFMNKLMNNPSNRAVNELYGFLVHNDIEILPNGNFLAWKKVTWDFKDIYTKSIDNSPGGKIPRMPYNMVDDNKNQTCSHGYHVCAKQYLPSYGISSGNKIVSCEVDPADVVSVPVDYNDSKLRCCWYQVVEDVTNLI
jgi:hypothetical protein